MITTLMVYDVKKAWHLKRHYGEACPELNPGDRYLQRTFQK